MKYHIIISLMYFLVPLKSQSILDVLVSLDYTKTKSKEVFQSIHKQSGAIFSYSDFNDEILITIKTDKLPLKDIIIKLENELFVNITVKDKYLIIKNEVKKEKTDVNIHGSIIDTKSDEPLSDASIFVKKHKILVNTGVDGRFAFRVPGDSKQIKINIAKANYIDTSVIIFVSKNQHLNIAMRSFPRQKISEFDSLYKKDLVLGSMIQRDTLLMPEIKMMSYNESFWAKQRVKNVNLINVSDTLLNRFSISLFPPISTNKLLSYHTKNTMAINVIGGHSKGLSGVEIGGVYNYDDGDVAGVQVAGVLNLVSQNVKGIQVSGVFNGVRGDFNGVQVGGVINLNDKNTSGLQISGLYQSTKRMNGLQVAGLFNKTHTLVGGQISGLVNVVDSAATNLQIAGLYNKATNIKGVQISGLINVCDTLEGLQIGIINRSNHIRKGFAVGLFNYVKNGYNKLEISYNELGTTSLGYRSGWAPLHFHYFGGVNVMNKELRFAQLGLGLATTLPVASKLYFQADANVRNSHDVEHITDWYFNMYNQLMIGISWQPAKKLGIRTGLSINHLWYDPASSLQGQIASLPKNTIYTNITDKYHHKIWLGWNVGLLLF